MLDGGYRGRVISIRELRRAHRRAQEGKPDRERPATRSGCSGVERPCPFVSCRHHLYLEVAANGSLRISFPDREPSDLPPDGSCSLDVAERGGATLEEVGALLNLTRERIRQIQEPAVVTLRRSLGEDAIGWKEEEPPARMRRRKERPTATASEEGDDEREHTDRGSFFASDDGAACRGIWQIYARASRSSGIEVEENAVGHAAPPRRALHPKAPNF
jgi:hypothetical protein